MIAYGTVKEIKPSQWTPSGKPLDYGGVKIFTEIVFTVDDWVQGDSPDEISVIIYGGQIGNIIFEYWPSFAPALRDFEEGGKYLLYVNYLETYEGYTLQTIDGI